MGLAPGLLEDMYSGRVEAFGMYATLKFLQYYLTCYCPLPNTSTINCFCDNLGVITTLASSPDYPAPRLNETTANDRDIYAAIHDVADKCPSTKFQYWHVKGHQDKDPKQQLTIPEQHNVDCDKLAKDFVHDHMLHSAAMSNPKFSATAPHLHIAGKTICRNILPALCQAAAVPAYWSYLWQQYQWTQSDLLNVH